MSLWKRTLALGLRSERAGLLSGTHPKWIAMKDSRIDRFATYMTGEMYSLLLEHSMIGRPASEPKIRLGFDLGLEAAERNSGDGDDGASASFTCSLALGPPLCRAA